MTSYNEWLNRLFRERDRRALLEELKHQRQVIRDTAIPAFRAAHTKLYSEIRKRMREEGLL